MIKPDDEEQPIDLVWTTWPTSRSQVESVFRELMQLAVSRGLGFHKDQMLSTPIEDVRYIRTLVHICYAQGGADIARGFLWVLAALGNEGAAERLVRELLAELDSLSARRAPFVLHRHAVSWLTEHPSEYFREAARSAETARADQDKEKGQQDGLVDLDLPEGVVASEAPPQGNVIIATLREMALPDLAAAPPSGSSDVGDKGAIVCAEIGDSKSGDGRHLSQRYGALIGNPLPFAGIIPNPAHVAQEMEAAFPWATSLARYLRGQLALLRMSQDQALKLPPLLLVGPPGIGKSYMLEWVCEKLEAKWQTIACGGVFDAGGLGAVARGWSSSRPAAPVQAMMDLNCANPVLILDEIDKGGQLGGRNGSIVGTLMSMIQNSGSFYDSCLLAQVDISRVSFLATANSIDALPLPLRDRFVTFHMQAPSEHHFDSLLAGVRRTEARRLGVNEEMLPGLSQGDRAWLRRAFGRSGCSIRALEQAHRLLLGELAVEELEAASRPH